MSAAVCIHRQLGAVVFIYLHIVTSIKIVSVRQMISADNNMGSARISGKSEFAKLSVLSDMTSKIWANFGKDRHKIGILH